MVAGPPYPGEGGAQNYGRKAFTAGTSCAATMRQHEHVYLGEHIVFFVVAVPFRDWGTPT